MSGVVIVASGQSPSRTSIDPSERRPEVARVAADLQKTHPRWSKERCATEAKALVANKLFRKPSADGRFMEEAS